MRKLLAGTVTSIGYFAYICIPKSDKTKNMLSLDELYKARYVLSKILRRTDLVHAPKLNPESDIYLKPENLQITGSFKVRGAYYMVSQLGEEERKKGVIACSAGNHAQGVALGATSNGIKSLICLPEGAPISKVEATRRLGAEICLVPGVYDDAYQRALQLRDEHGYAFVHPFNDERVIAGQGTIGLEMLDDLADVEAVVVPIGGGGLISGVAFAIKSLNPKVKVYGVQAAGAPSMYQSIHEHKAVTLPSVSTVADGIAVKTPGDLTFDICSKYVDDIALVSEDEICAAILRLMEEEKMIAEGAGAVSVAAAMFNKVPVKGKKTICLVSGGNRHSGVRGHEAFVLLGQNRTLRIGVRLACDLAFQTDFAPFRHENRSGFPEFQCFNILSQSIAERRNQAAAGNNDSIPHEISFPS